jgi:hypothetical protein
MRTSMSVDRLNIQSAKSFVGVLDEHAAVAE